MKRWSKVMMRSSLNLIFVSQDLSRILYSSFSTLYDQDSDLMVTRVR